jgi:site-specific DNA recombinase
MENEKIKIAVYTRVSTRDKQDVTKQRDYLLRFAGVKEEWVIYKIFVDKGISGTKANRPALDDMLAEIDNYDAVLVYKMDRLGRSLKNLFDIMEIFKAKNVEFISATESIDTSTPAGRMFFNMTAAFAQYEAEIIKQRIMDGLAEARRRGVKLGRKKGSKDRKPRRKTGYYIRHENERNDGTKLARSKHRQLLDGIKDGK